MQALVVQHPRPTGPGIACGALERRRLPAEQGKPTRVTNGDVTQRLAEQRTQTEVMILIDQRAPPRTLFGTNGTHAKAAEQVRRAVVRVGNITGQVCLVTAFAAECPLLNGTVVNSTHYCRTRWSPAG